MIPQRKGLAASLQGFTQVLVFALIAGLAARLVYRSGFKHAVGLAILMGLSWLAYRGSQRFSSVPSECGLPARPAGNENFSKPLAA